jgi:pantoate--beta-alanine ligase
VEIIKYKKDLGSKLSTFRDQKLSIGFVPTMGALHAGHISLIEICRKENDIVVSSVFVNPTQFNDKNDLARYPRMPEKDFSMLQAAGCDIVFYPEVAEMYPEEDKRIFHFGTLEEVMEGAHRPGHFNGVAQIVSKLFDSVMPTNAYFGDKDFQQLAIIKQLVKDLRYNINIVACPIVREPDGLAMSSRNLLLGTNERQAAPLIYASLKKTVELQYSHDIAELKNWVCKQIDANPFLKIEYFEIVDELTLQPVKSWQEKVNKVGCIAVRAGNIRLIDNVRF